MSKPCSCGGSNENCMYCYGRGFVGAASPEATSRDPVRNSDRRNAGTARVPGNPSVKCPVCDFRGSLNDFTRHFAERHGTGRRQPNRLRFAVVIPEQVCCLLCRNVIATSKFERHMRRSHPAGLGTHRHPVSEAVCKLCGARVRTSRLDRHMRKSASRNALGNVVHHGTTSTRQKMERFRSKKQGSVQTGGKAEALDKWKEEVGKRWSPILQPRCHKKPYAHAYREHGKFGSHPSHDGFDDEVAGA